MPRKPKKSTTALTDEQINRILRQAKKQPKKKLSKYDSFTRIRNYIMIRMAVMNGLRPKEIYNAKTEHINLSEGILYIPASNNKQRFEDIWYLPDEEKKELEIYLQLRNQLFQDNPWLFPAVHPRNKNGRLDRCTPTRIIKQMAKESGIPFRVDFYMLRHTFATKVQLKYKDLKVTANMLRHRDFQCRSALRYIHTAESSQRPVRINELWAAE